MKTKDPNSEPFGNYVEKYAEYQPTHLLGTMNINYTRGKKVEQNVNAGNADNKTKGTVFGYDADSLSMTWPFSYADNSAASLTDLDSTDVTNNIPDGALYAGDYVEYTLFVGADGNSQIPLQHVDGRFTVGKGQRIVGWEILREVGEDGTSVVTKNTTGTHDKNDNAIADALGHTVTATLLSENNVVTLTNAPASTDLTRLQKEDGSKQMTQVMGTQVASAYSSLKAAGYDVTLVYISDVASIPDSYKTTYASGEGNNAGGVSTMPATGTVVGQSLKADTLVPAGSPITLTVFNRPVEGQDGALAVPDVSSAKNLTQAAATKTLEDAMFRVNVVTIEDGQEGFDAALAGKVVAQSIAGGTYTNSNNITITVMGQPAPAPETPEAEAAEGGDEAEGQPEAQIDADTSGSTSAAFEGADKNRTIIFSVGKKNTGLRQTDYTYNDGLIRKGEGVYIRVITQMTDELQANPDADTYNTTGNNAFTGNVDKPSYSGNSVRATYTATSAPLHGYTQYYVHDKTNIRWNGTTGAYEHYNTSSYGNNSPQSQGMIADEGRVGISSYHELTTAADLSNRQQYGGRMTSTLSFYNHNSDVNSYRYGEGNSTNSFVNHYPNEARIEATFPEVSRTRSNQANQDGNPVTLLVGRNQSGQPSNVGALRNPTWHTNDITVTVNFTDAWDNEKQIPTGLRIFEPTGHNIEYPESMPRNYLANAFDPTTDVFQLGRKHVEIEYYIPSANDGEGAWLKEDGYQTATGKYTVDGQDTYTYTDAAGVDHTVDSAPANHELSDYMATRPNAVEGTQHVVNINLFREATAMRWTYFDVPATSDGIHPFELGVVRIDGVGRYTDLRALDEANAGDAYKDPANWIERHLTMDVAYNHYHNEANSIDFKGNPGTVTAGAALGDEAAGDNNASTIVLPGKDDMAALAHAFDQETTNTVATVHGQWQTKQDAADTTDAPLRVYRRVPNAQYQTQVFQTRDQAMARYDEDAAQKIGYVPGEVFWYKDTLSNAHLANKASAPSISVGSFRDNGNGTYSNTNQWVHNSSSSMSVRFSVYSPTNFTFNFSVSSESSSFDYIYVQAYKDGVYQRNYGNWGGSYTNALFDSGTLATGSWQFNIIYRKDGSVHSGTDTATVWNFNVGGSTGNFGQAGDPEKLANSVSIVGTQEESAGESEIYNPVFYERIPTKYLKAAVQAANYKGLGEDGIDIMMGDNYTDFEGESARYSAYKGVDGADIDEKYLEAALLGNIKWFDFDGNDVTADRTRGLKLKVTKVSEEEAQDTGGAMTVTSHETYRCDYPNYTYGRAYEDIDPATASNDTDFTLFKIEFVLDEDSHAYKNFVNGTDTMNGVGAGHVNDPLENRVNINGSQITGNKNGSTSAITKGEYLANELGTGSKLSEEHTKLRPTDRPDAGSAVMEVGDSLEISFPVRAATQDLPQVYVDMDASDSTAKKADGSANTTGLEPGYFPRFGEFYYSYYHLHCGHPNCNSNNSNFMNPSYTTTFGTALVQGTTRVANQNQLLDLNYLLHESAFSADKAKHVDAWKMFYNAYSFIPGTSNNNKATSYVPQNSAPNSSYDYGTSGSNGVFYDADNQTANTRQKVSYKILDEPTTMGERAKLPDYTFVTVNYTGADYASYVRDYFSFVTGPRVKEASTYMAAPEGDAGAESVETHISGTPLIWSQTRLHLQKAWLATSSEIVSDYDSRTLTNAAPTDYQAARSYSLFDATNGAILPLYDVNQSWYVADTNHGGSYNTINNYNNRSITQGTYTAALEYGQEYTSLLTAYNYGDRNLDGVEFTYVMPRGAEPVLDADGKVKLSVQLLQSVGNAIAGSGNASAPYVEETYANIPADLVDVEILQTPYGANHGYVAPSTHQDTARYRTGNTSTAGVTDFSSALDGAGQLVGTYTSVAATADGTPGTDDDVDENGRIVANPSKMKGYDYVTSSQPWALKITVKQDLGKWYGRNIDNQVTNAADPDPSKMTDCYSNGGYKIRVNLRSRIFANNESEDWYDRLLTAPWDDLAQ